MDLETLIETEFKSLDSTASGTLDRHPAASFLSMILAWFKSHRKGLGPRSPGGTYWGAASC